MTLKILRNDAGPDGTFGVMFLNDVFCCYSGELPWYGNIPNRSCIPAGAYTATWGVSPKFGPCYHIEGVKNRSSILIHRGNFCGGIFDGFKTETCGCILIGLEVKPLLGQKAVLKSGEAFARLEERSRKAPLSVDIRWAPPYLNIEETEGGSNTPK
jgi:hypothetical protein